ncbi:MAG: nucleotide sugar dehydrogenase [Thermodesulfobacteriota bacterium]|nr:nucleotide sugar dehydrogenase [Thermodesulfobacteriota bacterium]
MKISIFGLGYVGAVSAACLAREGHGIIGVDTVSTKVDMINNGQTPIIEKDIGEIIQETVESGLLRATADVADAVNNSELSLVCVGTPSQLNGDLDTSFVRRVCENIGEVLKTKSDYHVVTIRSTILPGTMWNVVIPALEEASGKSAGKDFGVCNNPEFLREGSAVYDFYHPPKTVIGTTDSQSGDLLASVYEKLDAPLIRTKVEVAEMVKYVDNVWHALKVGFGNEVGNICHSIGVDSHEVMDIFCSDTKLNISPYYLKPGFAFGGSCLPKDVRALTYKGKSLDLDLPILNAILPSNNMHVEKAIRMVVENGSRKIGFLGFSFKAGTDDLRESPVVEMIERLLGKGFDIRLYDKNVNLARLVGANKNFILNRIPHISKLMVQSMEEVLDHSEIIVIGNGSSEFEDILSRINGKQQVVDLVRAVKDRVSSDSYQGICW